MYFYWHPWRPPIEMILYIVLVWVPEILEDWVSNWQVGKSSGMFKRDPSTSDQP